MADDFRLQGKIELQDDSQRGVQQFEGSLRQMQSAVRKLSIAEDITRIETNIAKATGKGLEQALAAQRKVLQQIADERARALRAVGVDPASSAQSILQNMAGQDDRNIQRVLKLKRAYEEVRLELTRLDKQVDTTQGKRLDFGQVFGLEQIRGALERVNQEVGRVMDNALAVYSDRQRGELGLRSIARAFGQDLAAVRRAAEEATQDGILPLSAATASLRDLLTAGLNVQQAAELLQIYKDRAALGRAETVSYEQAVQNLAQAFKTESSELGNASGMSENFSQILKVGAELMGKQVDQLTAAERAQAKYLGTIQLSRAYVGGAATLTDSLAGAQARSETASRKLASALGEALAPAGIVWAELLTVLKERTAGFIQTNEAATRSIALVGRGLLTGATYGGGLSILLAQLGLVSGPIGLAIAGLTAAAGAVGGLVLNEQALRRERREHEQSTVRLADEYDRLNGILESTASTEQEKKQAAYDLDQLIQQIGDHLPGVVTKWDSHGQALRINRDRFDELADAARKAWKAVANGGDGEGNTLESLSMRIYELLGIRDEMAGRIALAQKALDEGDIATLNALGLGPGNAQAAIDRWQIEFDNMKKEIEPEIERLTGELGRLAAMEEPDMIGRKYGERPESRPTNPADTEDGGSGAGADPIAAMLSRIAQLRQLARLQSDAARVSGQGVAEALAAERQILTDSMAEIDQALAAFGLTGADSVTQVFEALSGASDETREKALRLKASYDELRLALLRLSGETRQGDITLSGTQVLGQLAVEGFRGAVQQIKSAMSGGGASVDTTQRSEWTGTLQVSFTGPGLDSLPATERDRLIQQMAAALASEINRDARATGINAGLHVIFAQQ